jgi:putative ABC transport system permease protein
MMRINNAGPPRLGQWVLKKILPSEERQFFIEGIEERYLREFKDRGRISALFWYLKDIFCTIPFLIIDNFSGSGVMFRNYIKVALRNIKKHKGYSIINIAGLAFGIACCLLIFRYVVFEMSYDNYHKDADCIYRINMNMKHQNQETKESRFDLFVPKIPEPLIGHIREDIPNIEKAVCISKGGPALISREDKRFYEDEYMYIDPEVFNIFTIPFVQGNPISALERPNTVVVTQRIAEKYFGNNQILGENITIDGNTYQITGVVENPPKNTHLKYDFIISFKTYEVNEGGLMSQWGAWGYEGYIKLANGVDPKDVEQTLDETYGDVMKGRNVTHRYFLEPVSKIHLNMKWSGEMDPKYLMILSIIALFVLGLACINFINMTTARSSHRAREIGLRKVVGAERRQLIRQFLCESVLMSLFAMLCALLLVSFIFPLFNTLVDRNFSLFDFLGKNFILATLGLTLTVGFLSGLYPSFILSSFRPVSILKNRGFSQTSRTTLRNLLIICQFTVSTVLIIGTLFIYKQVVFMKHTDLGFNKEQKLVIPIEKGDNYKIYKNEFLKHASITGATATRTVPGSKLGWNSVQLPGEKDTKRQIMNFEYVDTDFLEEYDIELVAGRFFNKDLSTDVGGPILVNEAAVRALGWRSPEEAVGKELIAYWGGDERQEGPQPVIGVVRDYHYEGLQNFIDPLVIVMAPSRFRSITLTFESQNVTEVLTLTEKIWDSLFPNDVFRYYFLDDRFGRLYEAEERLMRIVRSFTLLSIVISCLGLYGLAAFMAEKRTKEIGIRKVLGASVSNITVLFSKDFMRLIALANGLAWPIAYFAMHKWLQNFAYRIDLHLGIFIFSGICTLFVAFLTVSYQSIKAAFANPIDSLRYE